MLEKINLDIEQKAIGIAKYIINIKGYMEMIKAEEDRLYKKRKAAENRMEHLKSYLFKEMRKAFIMQIKGDTAIQRLNYLVVSAALSKTLKVPF